MERQSHEVGDQDRADAVPGDAGAGAEDRSGRPAEARRRTQELLCQTELVALDADGAEVIRVATAFAPEVAPGQYVQVGELVASPWSMASRSGVAYRAATL